MSEKISNIISRILPAVLLIIFTAFAAYTVNQRIEWILTYKYPLTTDSFFYLQEFRHRIVHGTGYNVSYSFFFLLVQYFSKLSGITDETVLFKIIVITGLTAYSAALGIFACRARAYFLIPGFFLLPWVSDLLFYRHYAFLKQSFSISLLLLGYSIYLAAAEDGINKLSLKKLFSLLLIGLSVMTHLFSAGVFACLLLFNFLIKNYSTGMNLFFGAAGIVLVYASSYFRNKTIFSIPPEQYKLSFQLYCAKTKCFQYDYLEFTLYVFLMCSLILFFYRLSKKDPRPLFFVLMYILLNLPVWNVGSGFVVRAAFSSVWLLLFSYAFGVIYINSAIRAVYLIVPAILLYGYFFNTRINVGEVGIPSAVLLKHRESLRKWIDEDAIIKAPHTVQYKLSYFLDRYSSRKEILQIDKKYKHKFEFKNDKNFNPACSILNDHTDELFPDAECVQIEKSWVISRVY